MSESVKVPEGMLKAATHAFFEPTACLAERSDPDCLRAGIEAAIRWLSENPIVPEGDDLAQLWRYMNTHIGGWDHAAIKWLFDYYLRRMFSLQMEDEEISDLLLSDLGDQSRNDFSRPTRQFFNDNVREAYRRGRKEHR